MSNQEIWDRVILEVSKSVESNVFEMWFSSMKILDIKDGTIFIELPNRFYKDWIEDNYPNIIKNNIESILKQSMNVKFKIVEKEDPAIKRIDTRYENKHKNLISKGINLSPKYTFNNFIVGPSNQFACTAAKKVSEKPGTIYNPLFIYGGVGLGKTHLMNAIGNMIFSKNTNAQVHYLPTEQFTNEVISAIRQNKMAELRNKYRNADVLLVDDIQFISNKTHTQEEFFYTFNALYANQRQIVISSDRTHLEISDITDRLRSRFGMGLIADIQPPELETKIAILYKKAEIEKLIIPNEVAIFICSRVKSNIRELEGCLIKLGAYSSLIKVPIDITMAKNILKDLLVSDNKPITIELVQKVVTEYFGIKAQDLKARKRTKEISNSRQIAMYIARQFTQMSLAEIGSYFGGKNHATVIYACKQVEDKRKQDNNLNKHIEGIIKRLQ